MSQYLHTHFMYYESNCTCTYMHYILQILDAFLLTIDILVTSALFQIRLGPISDCLSYIVSVIKMLNN